MAQDCRGYGVAGKVLIEFREEKRDSEQVRESPDGKILSRSSLARGGGVFLFFFFAAGSWGEHINKGLFQGQTHPTWAREGGKGGKLKSSGKKDGGKSPFTYSPKKARKKINAWTKNNQNSTKKIPWIIFVF